ncbi:aminoglycoside phosphotransferase family protein [Paenibacillus sp. LHD-117]|uniref:phosphotransferase family protein n=1 Tax=Paenibacillus sp. LHD-117 TaxID=3071412 RepID=UPI0027DECA94|nr:aminoglycoside phosphotransferase family protein [Paenibacillus sp. LHD-117]MDQ6419409.1 aminoglycoside phosphotransferase family protein [Paenibacillus sp. LHD-117]
MMAAIEERTLKWIERAVHPEAKAHSVERLKGGVSTPIHRVMLDVQGKSCQYVLRQFTDKEWLQNEPDLARHEAESLRRASGTPSVLAPEVVAYDETGNECGLPTLLMTHLEGQVVLEPENVTLWTDRMAGKLAQLHAGASVGREGFPWKYGAYSNPARFDATAWTAIPDQWKRAIDILMGPKPSFVPRFIHRDYHPTNMLWVDGEISGIVDWVNGCIGPAGIDVGHCRVNLCQLHSVDVADAFLAAYQRYSGDSFDYDPYWDLATLVDYAYWTPEVYQGWIDLGFTSLTNELVAKRLDAYLESVLARC